MLVRLGIRCGPGVWSSRVLGIAAPAEFHRRKATGAPGRPLEPPGYGADLLANFAKREPQGSRQIEKGRQCGP